MVSSLPPIGTLFLDNLYSKTLINCRVTSFTVNPLFVLDLRDDFIMNNKLKLYEFLGDDPVKAFHLGVHVVKWFELLDKKQQYLHAKSLRHNQEEVESYIEQMKYWTQSFPHASDQDEINTIELSEYIFDNLIWNEENEEKDRIKVALFLGMIVGRNADLSDEELLYNVH